MSRPYQFGDKEDRITSPLDRRAPAAIPAGQAPSFKTNVNRAKTKKWVEAKAPSYGGDDWDDYDEGDEYGVEAARDAPLPPPPGQNPGRSFTQPISPAVRGDRRNSFDAGDERRTFSHGAFPPDTQAPNPAQVPLHVETSIAAGKSPAADSSSQLGSARLPSASSDLSSTNPEHRRDFSPSALPTPLRAGGSPAVTSPTGQFPPRQASSGVAQHALPTEPPLPASPPTSFIRPADIWKRHMEEEQRRSSESQPQSIDSNHSQDVTSPGQAKAPLETLPESKGEYGIPGLPSVTAPATSRTGPRSSFAGLAMPEGIGGGTDFGDEFWSSTMGGGSAGGMTATAPASTLSPISEPQDPSLQHQPSLGFTSLVHQAFDTTHGVSKQDSLRSQTEATDSSISRSNTTGTSDISPIMSRVPSSAAAGAKLAERRQATPVIEEEIEGGSRRTSQATTEGNIPLGFTPGYRRDLTTPSPNNSPARSPAVETNSQFPTRGVAAEVGVNNPVSQALDPAAREIDIVEAIASSPDKDATFLASSEKAAQTAFLESHKSDIPAASPKITRAESPSKGRVADLAGKFDDRPNARRASVESWEADSVTSKRSVSPVKDEAPITLKPVAFERPPTERELSFRPKLPGGFESYASERSNSPVHTTGSIPQSVDSAPAPPAKDETGQLSDVNFTPTSAKHSVKGKDLTGSNAGPMAALAAAGAAMGEAFRKSLGADDEPLTSAQSGDRLRGDVYSRPAPPVRSETSTSSLPPTPLPKDDELPPLAPLKDRGKITETTEVISPNPARPAFDTQPSMDSGSGDFESDRLRREIVRSLSPEGDHRLSALAEDSAAARAGDRISNAIPSEYDSYWDASNDEKEKASTESSSKDVPTSIYLPVSPPESRAKSTSPNYLDKRFSWEKREDEEAAAATVAAGAIIGGGAAIAAHQASTTSSAPHPEPTSSSATRHDEHSSTLEPQVDPLSLNPKLSGEGLHIVNAEPGELPTPVETTISPNRFSHMAPELYVPPERELGVHGGLSPIANEPPSPISPIPTSPAGPRPPSGARPKTGEELRPASFREILAIKSTPARIAKYEETRHQFANTNTGLDNWLSRTLAAKPEHRDVATAAHRPAFNPGSQAGPRHKTTPSLSRVFTKGDSSPVTSTYADAGPEFKTGPVSAGASDHRASTGKSKELGKDILKTAGVLGGKGMKEAKGLFSKGKSRFRGSGTDKDEEGFHSRPQTPSSMSISSQDSRPPSSKRSSRSFSPFRRFSRPASVVISDHVEVIPGGSSGEQQPKSVPPFQGQYWPEPPLIPMLSSNPTPGSILHRSLTPQTSTARLGVLPSPARSAFSSGSPTHDLGVSPKEPTLESRRSTPPVSPPVDSDDTPTQTYGSLPAGETQLAPRAPNRIKHHQRIVSLLQPEDITPDDDKDEPVSPISPVEEGIPEGFTREVKPVGDALSPTSPAVSMDANSPVSLNPKNGNLRLPSATETPIVISRDNSVKALTPENGELQPLPKSRSSSNSWDRDSIAENHATGALGLDESTSEADEPSKPKEPKGKEKVDDLAKLNGPDTDLGSVGHSRGTSVSSAMVEQAQPVQVRRQSDLEPTRHVALKPNDRLKDGADRLAAIAEAHRKMRAQFEEEDALRETPHDFVVMESAAKKFDDYAISLHHVRRASGAQQSLQVPGQQWGAGRSSTGGRPRVSSITSTKTMPTGARPSMIITEPMPNTSYRTKSLGAASGDNTVPPPPLPPPSSTAPTLSVLPRTLPSVSSIGQEDSKASGNQSPIEPKRSVSPVKPAFETREYHPPNPNKERPMSFIPLARDPSGLPVQELISTAKHPLDLDTQLSPSEVHQPTPPSGGIRRMSRQFDNAQDTSPSGLRRLSRQLDEQGDNSPSGRRRLSRKLDEQGDASPSGRRRSRQISMIMGAVQDVSEAVPEQPKFPQPGTSRLSMTYSGGRPQSPPQPASRSLSMELEDPYRPIELYDRPSSGASTNFPPPTNFQTLVNQNLRHGPPDVRHQSIGWQEPATKPPPADPLKKQGILNKLKKKTSPTSTHPQLTMRGPLPRLDSPEYIAPPDAQRLLSLQSRTSTMGSQDAPNKKDKKKRASGFLSGLKRPVSANSTLSGESSPIHTHQASPVQPQFVQMVIPPSPQDSQQRLGSKSKKEKLPHRALTHTGQEVVGKNRFSALGSLFGRSGTTGHAPNTGKKLSKEQPKGTIFHRVPENPATSAFQAQQKLQAAEWKNATQRQGQHPPDLPLSPNQIGMPPPLDGYYAPVNIPPPTGQSFGHAAGVAGYDAIAAQQNRPPPMSSPVKSTNLADGRAGSNASSNQRWLSFGRHSSTGSEALLSPQVSAGSPMDQYQRHNSGDSVSPVSTRRDSSPGQVQSRPPRGFRMGSITETPGQHQERPWALNIPDAHEDEGDREIMRQEIYHAASARWKRGPDGQMYSVPSDQQSPLNSPAYPGGPTPTTSSHPQLQVQSQPQGQGSPSYPVFSHQSTQSPQPAQQQGATIYQPAGSPTSSRGASGEYQRVGIPGEYQRVGYRPHVYPPPVAPDEPQIPPLPQAHLPILQPQPKRMSYNGSPVGSPAPRFDHAMQKPQPDASFRSRSNVSAASATAGSTISADPSPYNTFVSPSPPSRGMGSAPLPRGIPNLGVTTSVPMSVHQLPRSHSYSQPNSQHVLNQQQRTPQSAHPASASSVYSDPTRYLTHESNPSQLPQDLYGYEHVDNRPAPVHEEDGEEHPPPPLPKDTPPSTPHGEDMSLNQKTAGPVPTVLQAVSGQGLGGNNLAAALAQAGVVNENSRTGHERNESTASDEMPVMKASGYPGDEWVPSWDGLD